LARSSILLVFVDGGDLTSIPTGDFLSAPGMGRERFKVEGREGLGLSSLPTGNSFSASSLLLWVLTEALRPRRAEIRYLKYTTRAFGQGSVRAIFE